MDLKAILYSDAEYVSIAENEATFEQNEYLNYNISNGVEIKIVASNGLDSTQEGYIKKE